MLVYWIIFVPALALLLVPITLFHGPKVRYRGITHDWRNIWPRALDLGLHTIDFGRAILGAWLLEEALSKAPEVTGAMRHAVMATQAVVLVTAVIIQTSFRAKQDTVHAPFAFVAGVILGFYPPAVAAYALLLAVVTTLGTKTLSVFFPILGLALAVVGTVFAKKFSLNLTIGMAVAMLPWFWSLLFHRELVSSFRARRPSDSSTGKSEPRI